MVNSILGLSDPFFRTSIGFDKMFDTLERLNSASNAQEGYPPYNLIRTGDDCFVIEVALAGFSKKEIDVEIKENVLHIKGQKTDEEEGKKNYIHKGIGGRRSHKTFTLAEYVEVIDGSFVDGILTIVCERIVPEEKKPRKVVLGDDKITVTDTTELLQE